MISKQCDHGYFYLLLHLYIELLFYDQERLLLKHTLETES